jgi:hypothetical protein
MMRDMSTVEYIQSVAKELAKMAERERLPMLTYVLRMAELEAESYLRPAPSLERAEKGVIAGQNK